MQEGMEIEKNFRQAILYVCLFLLFGTVFELLIPYYIHVTPEMDSPIDARIMGCHFFDSAYVQLAKNGGYIPGAYYKYFFPLDLAFPVFYTSMFLSVAGVFKREIFYRTSRFVIYAGMIFDYLENFSFALYLRSAIELSYMVAFFTTIKGILFLINVGIFFIGIIFSLFLIAKTKRSISAEI